jgi:hypothetical protein
MSEVIEYIVYYKSIYLLHTIHSQKHLKQWGLFATNKEWALLLVAISG